MPTPTPIHHPRFAQQMGQFYPFKVTIKTLNGTEVVAGLPCSYDAANGGDPEMFEGEAPASDRILISTWQPTITPKMQAFLEIGGLRKWFEINDVVPHNKPVQQTLLIVTPGK